MEWVKNAAEKLKNTKPRKVNNLLKYGGKVVVKNYISFFKYGIMKRTIKSGGTLCHLSVFV